MREPGDSVEIERIILTDLGVTPDRAGRIRRLVEVELQRLLQRERRPDGLASGQVRHLNAPTLHVSEQYSDGRLASGLAQSIAQALRGLQ